MTAPHRSTATERTIFTEPWWLDAVAPGAWGEVVIDRGGRVAARMPWVRVKRRGLTLLVTPPLTKTLGPWIRAESGRTTSRLEREKDLMNELIDGLPRHDYFEQNFHPSVTNWLPFHWRGFEETTRYTYVLPDLSDLDLVWKGTRQNVRTDVRKAERKLTLRDDLGLAEFLRLHEMTFTRQGMTVPYGRELIERVDAACALRDRRRMLFAADATGAVHAAAYIVWDAQSAYYLMSGSDPDLRNSGAGSFVLWEAIQFAAKAAPQFDFEGSMIEPIERFFRAFGAEQRPYFHVTKTSSRLLKMRRDVRSWLGRDVRPALTANAVAWVTRELERRIGGMPVPLVYETSDAPPEPCVVVRPAETDDWDALLARAATARCEVRGRALVVDADIVAATYFLLSRIEERDASKFDEHGRFPASASAALRLGLLDRPLVDEWAIAIRAGLRALLPGWRPDVPKFQVKLTHDVDSLRAFHDVGMGLRTVAGDLVKRRDVGAAITDAAETLRQVALPETSPNWRGALEIARLSRIHGLTSAFYFMSADPVLPDGDYDIGAADVRELIEELRALDAELGIHPGYHTLGDPARLAAEKARLDAVVGVTRCGGRQHYLRFRVPDTWRHWAAAGLAYDATLGFADREGFRCGTCHPFRPFDVEKDEEIALIEFPLIAMDATLRHHRGLTPEQTQSRLLELAQTCRSVGGVFTLLWHNSSMEGAWKPWGDVYRRLVPVLAQMQRETA